MTEESQLTLKDRLPGYHDAQVGSGRNENLTDKLSRKLICVQKQQTDILNEISQFEKSRLQLDNELKQYRNEKNTIQDNMKIGL